MDNFDELFEEEVYEEEEEKTEDELPDEVIHSLIEWLEVQGFSAEKILACIEYIVR